MRETEKQGVRIGVPYRNSAEELSGESRAHSRYLRAVEAAGGVGVSISLRLSDAELEEMARSVDGFVLPGSPRDVDPMLYKATRHRRTAKADAERERTDYFLLGHAFGRAKPVLAVCYGVQLLNVYLGGTLVQDIREELGSGIEHEWRREEGEEEPHHGIRIEGGMLLAGLLKGKREVLVNSSHHQAVKDAAKGLRVTAVAADGVIEAVEWTGGPEWVVGAQWHPERMEGEEAGDILSRGLFQALAGAARAGMGRRSARESAGGVSR